MTPRFRVVAGPNGSGKTTLARRLAASAAASCEAIARAFAAGLSVTVMRGGRIVRLSADGVGIKGESS